MITQVWCACGALDALIDANGNKTTWPAVSEGTARVEQERDWQNRVTREVRANGTTDTLYTYDVTGDGPSNWRSRATLVKMAHDPPRYERRLPDGAVEVFTYPDTGPSTPYRRVFLTQAIDPRGTPSRSPTMAAFGWWQ